MNRIVFDTETISLEKCFCYNLGYVISNEYGQVLVERDFVISQIYDNKPLFATSYYADKRPIYTKRLKGRTAKKVKWGDACRQMQKDIKEYGVSVGYAFNSSFDTKVFYFNHLFFRNKTRPLDTIIVKDIMDFIPFTKTNDYKVFCKNNGFMTSNGRVKKTAEVCYAYITNNVGYEEEHTALADSKIENEILTYGLYLLNDKIKSSWQIKK